VASFVPDFLFPIILLIITAEKRTVHPDMAFEVIAFLVQFGVVKI
jgi:hypothetical protein